MTSFVRYPIKLEFDESDVDDEEDDASEPIPQGAVSQGGEEGDGGGFLLDRVPGSVFASSAICPQVVSVDDLTQSSSSSAQQKLPPTSAATAILTKSDRELLSKSVIQPGFEKLETVPPYEERQREAKRRRKIEREKTKGKAWFDLPATEMTEERQRDLEVIKLQAALDPKHFYKKQDLQVLPKYFQIGKVVEHATDYYSDRVPKKARAQTIVEELLEDADFRRYQKRKMAEIEASKPKRRKLKEFRKAKKLKKKKRLVNLSQIVGGFKCCDFCVMAPPDEEENEEMLPDPSLEAFFKAQEAEQVKNPTQDGGGDSDQSDQSSFGGRKRKSEEDSPELIDLSSLLDDEDIPDPDEDGVPDLVGQKAFPSLKGRRVDPPMHSVLGSSAPSRKKKPRLQSLKLLSPQRRDNTIRYSPDSLENAPVGPSSSFPPAAALDVVLIFSAVHRFGRG
ncbi:unnamed protein product [Cyprideis torosa]|uniref:Uncharacterized protein n=1 Tax=Cyprideis torosa TaxID=163714 RepID=A0A7R8ZFR4_9CRUS|nr:unnamed protein product [Cyprideis torosa]CAG0879725.1 unnamed protein product [Cyprideis torosa]